MLSIYLDTQAAKSGISSIAWAMHCRVENEWNMSLILGSDHITVSSNKLKLINGVIKTINIKQILPISTAWRLWLEQWLCTDPKEGYTSWDILLDEGQKPCNDVKASNQRIWCWSRHEMGQNSTGDSQRYHKRSWRNHVWPWFLQRRRWTTYNSR